MTNLSFKINGMVIAIAFAASLMAAPPVAASQDRDEPEEAPADQKIKPLPGDKGCLHHIAQYDEEGNFVGYKAERGPCR